MRSSFTEVIPGGHDPEHRVAVQEPKLVRLLSSTSGAEDPEPGESAQILTLPRVSRSQQPSQGSADQSPNGGAECEAGKEGAGQEGSDGWSSQSCAPNGSEEPVALLP